MNIFRNVLAVVGVLALVAVGAAGQTAIQYLNGVPYQFPSAAGAVGEFLGITSTSGSSITLGWETPPTPEGLPAGTLIAGTFAACPSGWTRYTALDNKFPRGAATAGGTGGADTHTHDVTGVTGSQGVSISGNTGSTTASHTHTYSGSGTTGGPDAGITADPGFGAAAADPHDHNFSWFGTTASGGASHLHAAGSLSGGSHGHTDGNLTAASASNVPAYVAVLWCRKD
jgi:hypothetical protein